VSDVAHSKTTWSGGPGSHTENHLLFSHLGEEPPQRVVAIPLLVRGRTVAVLYADSAELDSEAINLEALETLVRVAAMAVELLASRSTGKRPATERRASEADHTQESSSYVPAREYQEPQYQESQPQFQDSLSNFQDSQSNYQETPATFTAEPQYEPEPQPEVFESNEAPSYSEPQPVDTYTTAPEAESVPEHVTSSISDVAPAATGRRRYGMDVDLPVEVAGEEERRLHNDARRFARLLVSEIKLYNEQKVMEGRSHQDLYERLLEYIDRSRDMYDKRVKPEVAKKYDYFHHELVTTLAEGDAEKLGNAYPGATVTA
jgi:hypothetical protein